MGDYQLIMNLRGRSWDFIPDDLWTHLVRGFLVPHCDAFSMNILAEPDDIHPLEVFADVKPAFCGHRTYGPYDVPVTVRDPDGYKATVAAFQFDSWIAEALLKQPFNTWNVSNEGSEADELMFWQGDSEKVLAVPYEGQIFFYDLNADERASLLKVDPRIPPNLHSHP